MVEADCKRIFFRPKNKKYRKTISFQCYFSFYQGFIVVENLINNEFPDVITLQEHWLTPDNLTKFEQHFTDFFGLVAQLCQVVWKPVCYEVGLLAA